MKNKNILETSKIEISNKNNRILIKGEYNYNNNFIDIILNLSQNNEIYLTTLIKGNLNNPNIWKSIYNSSLMRIRESSCASPGFAYFTFFESNTIICFAFKNLELQFCRV